MDRIRKEQLQPKLRRDQLDVLRSIQLRTLVPMAAILRRAIDEFFARHGRAVTRLPIDASAAERARMEKIVLNLRPDQLEQLREMATNAKAPMAALVRLAVDEFLAMHGDVPAGISVEDAVGALAVNARRELRALETIRRRAASRAAGRTTRPAFTEAVLDQAAK